MLVEMSTHVASWFVMYVYKHFQLTCVEIRFCCKLQQFCCSYYSSFISYSYMGAGSCQRDYSCIFHNCSWLGLKMYKIYTQNFHLQKTLSTFHSQSEMTKILNLCTEMLNSPCSAWDEALESIEIVQKYKYASVAFE